jgi:DNA-binding beta-propeller fold protein YncE
MFSHARQFLILAFAFFALSALSGCDSDATPQFGSLDEVWGRRGLADGRFQKPRAITVDAQDRVYVVDMTARIQVFTPEGKFLRGWQTPVHEAGRPTGLSIDRQGRVLVPDTHYYRVLIYSPEGQLLQTIGGVNGPGPGQFGFVTDVVEDSQGNLYVSEYGEWDRIQKFSAAGKFLLQWGGHGSGPGEFVRPQSMAIDNDDQIWVADSCNHRIQIFDTSGKLLKQFGQQGAALGELCYPYGLAFDADQNLFVCEYGNHRVQKFSHDGRSLGCWGRHGRAPGELFAPWGVALDRQGQLHVLDTMNHRVQRVRL